MEKVIKGVKKLKEEEMPKADALVVFSCAERILSFGPMMTEELEGIKKRLERCNGRNVQQCRIGPCHRRQSGNAHSHHLLCGPKRKIR